MPLVSLNDISIRFTGPNLLDGVNCTLDRNQRIGLLGRNGAGKSTLMKIISGDVEPDDGQVLLEQNATISRLTQEVPENISGTIPEVIRPGL
jgi:ATP-binding cassette subfamily F protein uup